MRQDGLNAIPIFQANAQLTHTHIQKKSGSYLGVGLNDVCEVRLLFHGVQEAQLLHSACTHNVSKAHCGACSVRVGENANV